MSEQVEELWRRARPAFGEEGLWERARTLGMSVLTCLGRRTVTGMLTASGQQDRDWSAAYRLFEEARYDPEQLFAPAREEVLARLPEGARVTGFLDDTLFGKRGRRVAGASWRRDPLGPPFQTNLIWAQRFVQTALALPEGKGAARARAIPVQLQHAPTAPRPTRSAPPEAWARYRQEQQVSSLSWIGVAQMCALREALDRDPRGRARLLLLAVDGSYTNRTVFRGLPPRTEVIGRVRKDAALFSPPKASPGRGRPRVYGSPLPTPEQVRQDPSFPWQQVEAYAAGRVHTFHVKTVAPVRWKAAGERDLLLLVVRPLAYRPRKGSRVLYREPAYLLCSTLTLPLAELLQAFLWRWETEVAFREEKSLLGMGEAQVRTTPAVALLPAFVAAMYAYLHVAGAAAHEHCRNRLTLPKWRVTSPQARCTTSQLQGLLRAELWGRALGVTIGGFGNVPQTHPKPLKIDSAPAAAIIYAQR